MTKAATTLYADRLVEITEQAIVLQNCYFPFGARRIPLADIERIEVYPATLLTGKYRLFGSGDLRTWFPLDWRRPTRDRIFLLRLTEGWFRVGFTVEDAPTVERILTEKRLLVNGE